MKNIQYKIELIQLDVQSLMRFISNKDTARFINKTSSDVFDDDMSVIGSLRKIDDKLDRFLKQVYPPS